MNIKATLEIVVSNRDFLPDRLVTEARADILDLRKRPNVDPGILDDTATKLGGVRLDVVGARPGAFDTVCYFEKILERNGVSVATVDLSEIFGAANKNIHHELDLSKSSHCSDDLLPVRLGCVIIVCGGWKYRRKL